MQKKFKIQIDFEGIQEALQPYDDLTIEADNQAEAEKLFLKKIKDDCVSPLPYFAICEEDDDAFLDKQSTAEYYDLPYENKSKRI